jgi:tellurite resistance protein
MPDEKEDDLLLGGDEPTGEEAEYYEDLPDLHSEVNSACNALVAIAEIDDAILSKEKRRMINAIRRKSLEIIHRNILDIHAEVFGRNEEESEDDDE